MNLRTWLFIPTLAVTQATTVALAAPVPPSVSPKRQPLTVANDPQNALRRLKSECDNPKVSNESQWTSYSSRTEFLRRQCIGDLKPLGAVGLAAVRRELVGAKGEYRQMLTVALAALGDQGAMAQTVTLMLHAEKPAVRFVAAAELSKLENKALIEPFKQALRDQFKRRDGSCVQIGNGMIYPVRLIASGALVRLGVPLDEVRKIGDWRDWSYLKNE
jgi:hypothetical protein